MPGGKNSYTRPYNRDEKNALKRSTARKAAMENIHNAKLHLGADNSQSVDDFRKQIDELSLLRSMIEESNIDDRKTLIESKFKGQDRKANRYKYNKGGAVKGYMGGGKVRGYKNGGSVCRGGGAAVSGTKFSGVK